MKIIEEITPNQWETESEPRSENPLRFASLQDALDDLQRGEVAILVTQSIPGRRQLLTAKRTEFTETIKLKSGPLLLKIRKVF